MYTYLGFLGCVYYVDEEVSGLDETPDAVDGDDHVSIGLEESIVQQQWSTEECNCIRYCLKPFWWFSLPNCVECGPIYLFKY